jgi:hypothetical protein
MFYKNFKNKKTDIIGLNLLNKLNYALSTLPLFKQRVQTYSEAIVPFSFLTLTFCKFASKRTGVFLLEWLTKLPDNLPLPHTLQTLLIIITSKFGN